MTDRSNSSARALLFIATGSMLSGSFFIESCVRARNNRYASFCMILSFMINCRSRFCTSEVPGAGRGRSLRGGAAVGLLFLPFLSVLLAGGAFESSISAAPSSSFATLFTNPPTISFTILLESAVCFLSLLSSPSGFSEGGGESTILTSLGAALSLTSCNCWANVSIRRKTTLSI